MVAPEKAANDYQSKAMLSCHEWGEPGRAFPPGVDRFQDRGAA
jgi:hypothetical protein